MREIEFRGKSNSNKWIYGQLVKDLSSDRYIILEEPIEWVDGHEWCGEIPYNIEQNTISQFTGLKDKNDIKIYEGDIIKLDTWKCIHEVKFVDGAFCLDSGNGYLDDIHYVHHAGRNQASVIGNIYDNPELVKRIKEVIENNK